MTRRASAVRLNLITSRTPVALFLISYSNGGEFASSASFRAPSRTTHIFPIQIGKNGCVNILTNPNPRTKNSIARSNSGERYMRNLICLFRQNPTPQRRPTLLLFRPCVP